MINDLTREIQVGEIFTGKVAKIASFGAFVTLLPGTDGMVHISELDESRVEKVEDVVNVGDNITVKVINIDNGGKIKLSRKAALNPSAVDEVEKSEPIDINVGDIITGEVVNITKFGAFVEVAPGTDGMVHISELENYRVANVEDVVSVGEEITVEVIEINEKLIDEPETVNASPLEEGWFYKIKVNDMEGFEDLMTEEEYKASCLEE